MFVRACGVRMGVRGKEEGGKLVGPGSAAITTLRPSAAPVHPRRAAAPSHARQGRQPASGHAARPRGGAAQTPPGRRTICFPIVIVDMSDGLKASPENSTSGLRGASSLI